MKTIKILFIDMPLFYIRKKNIIKKIFVNIKLYDIYIFIVLKFMNFYLYKYIIELLFKIYNKMFNYYFVCKCQKFFLNQIKIEKTLAEHIFLIF